MNVNVELVLLEQVWPNVPKKGSVLAPKSHTVNVDVSGEMDKFNCPNWSGISILMVGLKFLGLTLNMGRLLALSMFGMPSEGPVQKKMNFCLHVYLILINQSVTIY